MTKRSGGQAVVEALEDEGVPFTFGIPGTHNIELYDALSRSGRVHPVLVTDEQSASFMADGVWRASGRLGCVNLVPGAGLTHALSGVAEAYLDTVPMLVLACGIRRDSGRAYQLHDIDQAAVARAVTKAQLRPASGGEIYATVRRGCRLAREGAPGPVMVEIPAEHYLFRHDVPEGEAAPFAEEDDLSGLPADAAPGGGAPLPGDGPRAGAPGPRPSVAGAPHPPGPDPVRVEEALEVLAVAERPLLYVGLGAAGAAPRLPALAEALEAPVSTTFQGKGVFPESHPLWLWPGFGETAPPFVREVAEGCDATLAVGCRFSEVGTGSWSFAPPGPLVHVDIDPDVFHRNFPARVAVRSDASLFVDALLERMGDDPTIGARGEDPTSGGSGSPASGDSGSPPTNGAHRFPRPDDGALRERIRRGHQEVREEQLAEVGGDRVTPAYLMQELQRTFGAGAVYTTDSGNGTFLALEGLRLEAPGKLLAPVDYSCMGYAVPAALGAKLARPDLPVVALAGDGAFLMTGLELLTAAREEVPVAVFVLRDRQLAQISQFQDVAFNRRTASELADYDLASLCRGAGVETLRLASDEGVPDVLAEAARRVEAGAPVAVEVEIDYSRKTWFTRGVVKTTLGRLPWPDRLRFLGRALWRRVTG